MSTQNNIFAQALAGNIAPSNAAQAGGGGIKVGAGSFKVKFSKAVVDFNQSKSAKQLILTCAVVETIEDGEEQKESRIGGTYNWYFPVGKEDDHRGRLLADLVELSKQLGFDPAKLAEDAQSDLDIYSNFAALCAKPIARGTIGAVGCVRVHQKAPSKYYNHFTLKQEATQATTATAPADADGL